MKVKTSLQAKRGQNTAEYLIMLTLVVIGSIGLWTAFGKTIHGKIAYVSAAISGNTEQHTKGRKTAHGAAEAARTAAQAADNIKMEGINDADLKSLKVEESGQ